MKLQINENTLRVSGVTELSAANANLFRDEVRTAFADTHRNIEIDLSQTSGVDSCGLGALVALHKSAQQQGGILRLLNPTPPVHQMLELTRMHRIFEIIKE